MKEINYLLRDEKSAPHHYKMLLPKLKYKSDKRIVRGIIADERHHHMLLNKIKRHERRLK